MLAGLEIAGGAALAAGLGIGRHNNKRDKEELGSCADAREKLRGKHAALSKAHKSLTDAWGGQPLSLVDERHYQEATERGVPDWAILCVRKAQGLIKESCALTRIVDMYVNQLEYATTDCVVQESVDQDCTTTVFASNPAVDNFAEQLEDLERRMSTHVPFLEKSRSAFDSPQEHRSLERCVSSIAKLKSTNILEAPAEILRQRNPFAVAYRRLFQGTREVGDFMLPNLTTTEFTDDDERQLFHQDYSSAGMI